MRTFAIPTHCAIAVVAKDTKPGRVTLLMKPGIERVAATATAVLARSLTVDVIERQKHFISFPAALAGNNASAVVDESFAT